MPQDDDGAADDDGSGTTTSGGPTTTSGAPTTTSGTASTSTESGQDVTGGDDTDGGLGEDDGSTSSDATSSTRGIEETGESTGALTGPPCDASVWDDFTSPNIDPQWDVWTYGAEPDVVQQDGTLRIAVSVTDGWLGVDRSIGAMEGHTVAIEWSFDEFHHDAYAWFYLSAERKYEFGVHSGLLEVRMGGQSNPDVILSLPFDEQSHRFVRIGASAAQVHWDVSNDGLDWTTVHTDTPVAPADVHLVGAGIGSSKPLPGEAAIHLEQMFRCP